MWPVTARPTPRLRAVLTRNVIVLGVVSLLNDTATEMMIPLLPLFLTNVLGAGALALGFIEGAADATASILKLVSGKWSDRTGKRRPLVIAGYALASIVRPFIAATTAAWQVLAIRVTDRVGKGLRTSPRDALLAGSVAPRHRGLAFSVHRSMDHSGAVIGPLLAAAYLFAGHRDLRILFWLTAIPGALVLLVLVFGVREQNTPTTSLDDGISPLLGSRGGERQPPSPSEARAQPSLGHDPRSEAKSAARPTHGPLVRVLVPIGLFTLGNSTDVFLLLAAGGARAPIETLPLLWMGLHVVKAASSLPGGWLADRFGRRRIIAMGWLYYAGIYAAFAYAESQAVIWALFLAYGVYHGLTEGAERALVSELVPSVDWGSGFGWYHMTVGMLTLGASVLFGGLWEVYSKRVAFLSGAGFAAVAVVALVVLARPRSPVPARA